METLIQEIMDLEKQQDDMYAEFIFIRDQLEQKRRLRDAFLVVKDSPTLQESLRIEMEKL